MVFKFHGFVFCPAISFTSIGPHFLLHVQCVHKPWKVGVTLGPRALSSVHLKANPYDAPSGPHPCLLHVPLFCLFLIISVSLWLSCLYFSLFIYFSLFLLLSSSLLFNPLLFTTGLERLSLSNKIFLLNKRLIYLNNNFLWAAIQSTSYLISSLF